MQLRVEAPRGVSFGMVTIGSSCLRLAGASSAGLLLLGAAATARAECAGAAVPCTHEDRDEGTRFHLSYEAPSGCPDRTAFLGAIRVRTKRPQLAAAGEPALTFGVSVEPREGGLIGRLDVREPGAGDGPPQKRTVSSGTCVEVTKALALVVALILDPDAETGPEPQAAPVPAPVPDDDRPPAPVSELPPVPPARRPRPERPSPGRPEVRRPVELSAGADLAMTGAIGPGIVPRGEVFVDAAFMRAGEEPRRGLAFAPSLRVGTGFGATSKRLAGGSHAYWWAGGTALLCPVRVGLPGTLRLVPCGGMEVGALHGSTRGLPNGASSTGLWLAPVARAGLEWPLSSSVTLELHAGAVFPLMRTRFFLAPDTTIFQVPAVAGTGAVAARFRFW